MSDESARPASETARRDRLELVAVVVLAATTILTAWCAFESSKWGGAMSISFSQASTARIEASRDDATANVRQSNHIGLWTAWATATGDHNQPLADFIESRFPEPLATAHKDWLAAGGLRAPEKSPFEMPSYVLPERTAAQAADALANQRYATALRNNQRGDNYTILTVLFATVLFFTAMSGKVRRLRAARLLLGLAVVLGCVGLVFLSTFPKLV